MSNFRTHTMTVIGPKRAILACRLIVEASQWFEFTPLPDDRYEFAVKAENAGLLQQVVTETYDVFPLAPGEDEVRDDEE